MADLPAFLTTAYEPCFTHTGVDCFGPLNVKRGRAVVKRRGVMFTCLNSGAVHLDLAFSLDSDCFINVLRTFTHPKFIHSESGTNLLVPKERSENGIENWNQKLIQDRLLQKGCQWVSNSWIFHSSVAVKPRFGMFYLSVENNSRLRHHATEAETSSSFSCCSLSLNMSFVLFFLVYFTAILA